MADTEQDLELLPFDEAEILTAEEELDAAELSLLDDVMTTEGTDSAPVPFGRTPFFDFETGRFATSGGTAPVWVTGQATLFQWIQTALKIPQGGSWLFPLEYGLENADEWIGQSDPDEAISDLEEKLPDCLLFHDRIATVDDFDADHDPSAGVITLNNLTIVTDEADALTIESLEVEGSA